MSRLFDQSFKALLSALSVISLFSLMSVACGAAQRSAKPLDAKASVAEYLACLASHKVTLVSAHRGGPRAGFPENALQTLQKTVDYGSVLLEVDVRESADGKLVLMHDETLERTSNGAGYVADYTWAQLRDIRLRDTQGEITPFAIPTLQEVLAWAKDRAILQLDVKRGIDIAKVARAVVNADAMDSTLLITYGIEDAAKVLGVDKGFSFSLSIDSREDLDTLDEANISPHQIVAWTGVVKTPEKAIWPVLESRDIVSSVGAIWTLEQQILASGDPQAYIDLANKGLDIIAADHYRLAYDTLATRQDLSGALVHCQGR